MVPSNIDHDAAYKQVFETEPNDFVPDDQVFDLLNADFDDDKKEEEKKDSHHSRNNSKGNSARVSFRTKRLQ